MHLITYSTFLLSAHILLFNFCLVLSDEVPAVLWNIKGDAMQVKAVSALARDDIVFAETLRDVLQNDANILLFAVNKLSLEDFSSSENPLSSNNTLQNLQTFLDTQRYMIMSSIKDPMKHIHESHCGVQEIVVDQSIDENILQSIAVAFQRSCIVILHITDAGVVGILDPKLEDIRKVFLPSFDKTPKKIVGVFTAMKSSWGNSNEEHHSFRNLLETEEAAEDGNFKNITGCLIMYAENTTISMKTSNRTVFLSISSATTDGSMCGNSSAELNLNFKPSEEFSTVVLKFNFTISTGSWIAQAIVETTGGQNSDIQEVLVTKDISAPLGFSFSCGKLVLRSRNSSNLVKVTIDRFQVQPFGVKGKFSESFDCVTWFTIPIWMGIFISLLFIAITNCGVYALYSVKTMDRFDDPKGKTITVAAAAD